ncbi:hypothetical protein EV2_044196 [Malus domestica]
MCWWWYERLLTVILDDYHMYLRAQLMKILLIANDKCYEHGKSITNFKSAFQMKLAERMLRQDVLGGHQYTRYS